jgi:hypothetical protein
VSAWWQAPVSHHFTLTPSRHSPSQFQDCDVQLQRALNKEDFELAQAFRAQRARVDDALDQLRAFRAAAAAAASSSDSDSVDDGLAALRLRSDLAAAVEAEE